MKNVVMCKYGHYYNAELYSQCPHCEKEENANYIDGAQIYEHSAELEKSVEADRGNHIEAGDDKQKKGGIGWPNLFYSKNHKMKSNTQEKEKEILYKEKAEDISQTIQLYEKAEDISQTMQLYENEENNIEDMQEEMNIGIHPVTPNKTIMKKPHIEYAVCDRNQELERFDYREKRADDIGKTIMVQYGQGEGENIPQGSCMTEPVAGWLVCIKGRYLGQSFVIKAGKSILGRNADSDICIEESTVSHEQALIMFEPRTQQFYLKGMEKAAFMYVNKEPIMDRIQLNSYDCIEIGEKTAFIFIPLCGERFDWKNYANGDN